MSLNLINAYARAAGVNPQKLQREIGEMLAQERGAVSPKQFGTYASSRKKTKNSIKNQKKKRK